MRQVADDNGVIVLARDYGPYGQVIGEYGAGSSGYGYAGEQTDVNTALVFLRARWYDPYLNQFLSPDPWEGRRRSRSAVGWVPSLMPTPSPFHPHPSFRPPARPTNPTLTQTRYCPLV